MPYFLYLGVLPNLAIFHAWGTIMFAHFTLDQQYAQMRVRKDPGYVKSYPKAREGFLVGIEYDSGTYLMYDEDANDIF